MIECFYFDHTLITRQGLSFGSQQSANARSSTVKQLLQLVLQCRPTVPSHKQTRDMWLCVCGGGGGGGHTPGSLPALELPWQRPLRSPQCRHDTHHQVRAVPGGNPLQPPHQPVHECIQTYLSSEPTATDTDLRLLWQCWHCCGNWLVRLPSDQAQICRKLSFHPHDNSTVQHYHDYAQTTLQVSGAYHLHMTGQLWQVSDWAHKQSASQGAHICTGLPTVMQVMLPPRSPPITMAL